MKLINDFDPAGRLLRFDPWHFSKAYENSAYRLSEVMKIISRIEATICGAAKADFVEYLRKEDLNILVEVRVSQIQESCDSMPDRSGTVLEPTFTGYAPEAMFNRLVERRVLKKLQKGQAQSLPGDHFRSLIVDVSRLPYTSEFTHRWYLQQFGQSVKKYLQPKEIDVDLVVFCYSRPEPGSGLNIPLMFRKSNFPNEAFIELFGKDLSFDELSPEVFIDRHQNSDH